MTLHHLTPSDVARFWAKVDRRGPNECWPWKASSKAGYGRMKVQGLNWATVHATHISLHIAGKPRPENLFALHSCDNPICVNPRHLRWGTDADNGRDKRLRKRAKPAMLFGSSNGKAKLTESDVRNIRALRGKLTVKQIAEKYGLHEITVFKIRSGRLWGHLSP